MKKYNVLVEETLSRLITVRAKNEEDAVTKVTKKYKNEDIVLDYSDLSDVTIWYNLYA